MKDDNSIESGASPKKWWQWFFMYPAVGVALLGSLPTIYELYNSWKIDVPYGESQLAAEQNVLWQTNFDCSKEKFKSVKNVNNIEVGAIVCATGDVLLKVASPNASPMFRWVGLKSLSNISLLEMMVSSAHAENFVVGENIQLASNHVPVLICQRWLKPGTLLRRVSVSNEGCFDEVLNTFTGAILSRVKVPCNPQC